MSEIEFLCFNQVNPEDFMGVVNEDSLRTHLIDHPYFDAISLQAWMGDKIKTDEIQGCRIRAVYIGGTLAGWCGIQPDDNGFELAIVSNRGQTTVFFAGLGQLEYKPWSVPYSPISWAFLVTYKLPPEVLGGFLGNTGEFLHNEKFYFFPLVSALVTSVFTNVMQAKVYKAHIHDLTEHRKKLVHGFESGELEIIKNHTSSGFDVRTGSIKNGSGNKK